MPNQATQVVGQAIGWRMLKALFGLAFVALAGCFGPPTMHYDVQEYNKQVVSSEQEMLLYNIGRLNKKQPPHFMMVSSVSQTRSFSAGLSFQWSQLWDSLTTPSAAPGGTVKGSGVFTAGPFTAGGAENPTITFVPIQGQDFALRFESSLTDKFTLFMEDREWYATAAEKEAIVLLFAQSLVLSHGDDDKCKKGTTGFYVNRPPEAQDLYPAETHYYSELSDCVNEIVESAPYYEQIDGSYPVPTKASPSEAAKAADLITALGAGYEFTKEGKELTVPIRIPAFSDYDLKFVAPAGAKPRGDEPVPPVFTLPAHPNWSELTYFYLPKDYKPQVYSLGIHGPSSAQKVNVLVPDGYGLARDENGNLRVSHGSYIAEKKREMAYTATGQRTSGSPIIANAHDIEVYDVGNSIAGVGVRPNTTIVSINSNAHTVTMSHPANANSDAAMIVGDGNRFYDRFSYADEVVANVWPVTKNYLYIELRKNDPKAPLVTDEIAERACFSQPDKDDPANNVVCGFLKIGNLLQIMQRLAEQSCTSGKKSKDGCGPSIFGIGSKKDIPSWADSWAPFTYREEDGSEEKKWVWVPAHDPQTDQVRAERDRMAFFNLYKLYQMSLVDTSKLVTGAPPVTISK